MALFAPATPFALFFCPFPVNRNFFLGGGEKSHIFWAPFVWDLQGMPTHHGSFVRTMAGGLAFLYWILKWEEEEEDFFSLFSSAKWDCLGCLSTKLLEAHMLLFPSLGGWCGGDIPILEPMETSLPTKVGERKKRKEKFRSQNSPARTTTVFIMGRLVSKEMGRGWNTRKGRQLSVFPQINRPWVFSPPNALLSQ